MREDPSATDSFQRDRRRGPTRARLVGAALTSALLVTVVAGCLEHRERELPPLFPDPRKTSCYQTASTRTCGEYSLGFAGTVLPGAKGAVDPIHTVLAGAEGRPPQLVGSWWVGGSGRQEARTSIMHFPEPADSTTLDGCFLLQPFVDPSCGEQRLLTWNPTLRYTPADAANRLSPEELFVHNYSKETLLPRSECLLTALRAAARGESLAVSNQLRILSASGEVIREIHLGSRQKPMRARLVTLQGRQVALVNFNSGYQVSEVLYRELMHPQVAPGKLMSPAASDAVFGSFRGVVAVDLETGEKLWQRRLGAPPHTEIAWDLDGDQLDEIICLTNSPENGVNGSGVTDARCAHVLCFDHEGNELWRYRLTGPFLRLQAAVGDLTDAPGYEVVVVHGSDKSRRVGAVSILSSCGELLAQSWSYGSPRGLVLVDLDGDQREEIVVGGASGYVYALDGSLNTVASFADTAHRGYDHSSVCLAAANDIDGDGEIEILVTSLGWTMVEWRTVMADGSMVIDPCRYVISLGEDLKEETRACVVDSFGRTMEVGRGPGANNAFVSDLDSDGWNELVLEHNAHGAYVFEIIPAEVLE